MLSQQAEAQVSYSKPFFLKKVDTSFLFLTYLCIYFCNIFYTFMERDILAVQIFKNNLFTLCVLVFFLHACLYEGVGSPGTEVTNRCGN